MAETVMSRILPGTPEASVLYNILFLLEHPLPSLELIEYLEEALEALTKGENIAHEEFNRKVEDFLPQYPNNKAYMKAVWEISKRHVAHGRQGIIKVIEEMKARNTYDASLLEAHLSMVNTCVTDLPNWEKWYQLTMDLSTGKTHLTFGEYCYKHIPSHLMWNDRWTRAASSYVDEINSRKTMEATKSHPSIKDAIIVHDGGDRTSGRQFLND